MANVALLTQPQVVERVVKDMLLTIEVGNNILIKRSLEIGAGCFKAMNVITNTQ
jgi:hypothetical protein